jgi:DNA-binding HxlR family transcriptional regulator
MNNTINTSDQCDVARCILTVKDALNVLHGTWKLPILVSLKFGKKRFKEISREMNGISDKVLSKELKDLEANQLVKRTVGNTFPPSVDYAITDHGLSLDQVIDSLQRWGITHRQKIMGK